MLPYQAKSRPIYSARNTEVFKKARSLFNSIKRRTKRQPYLRSAYFHKEKIFLDSFWPHLNQKPAADRLRRLKLLPCAIELIEKSKQEPTIRLNPNKPTEVFYRFRAMTPDNHAFYVQIKENTKTGKRYFMSVFYDQ